MENEPKCPCCGERTIKFVPLIYSGNGITDYMCRNAKCEYEVHIMISEK